jgi:hypothetical protein
MRFTGYALKRAIVAGLAGLLIVPAPAALAESGARGQAEGADETPQITLYGTAFNSWELSTSGRVTVDGHLTAASDRLQNGSLIIVDSLSSAKAEIKDVGRVSIAPRSELVLDFVDNTVVARMLAGTMRVEVAARYGAYIETPYSRVVAHPGSYASFRVATNPDGTSLDRDQGDVEMSAADNGDDWEIDDDMEDDDFHIKARKKEELRVKVKNGSGSEANQPVVFAIVEALDGASGSFGEGVQRVTTSTDSDGVAKVDFYAGAGEGQVQVQAFVPGTDARETLTMMVDAPEKTFWNKYTTGLYVALGAGAVAGAALAIKNAGGDDRGNIPPPTVIVR